MFEKRGFIGRVDRYTEMINIRGEIKKWVKELDKQYMRYGKRNQRKIIKETGRKIYEAVKRRYLDNKEKAKKAQRRKGKKPKVYTIM
jgi:hypothetical protein